MDFRLNDLVEDVAGGRSPTNCGRIMELRPNSKALVHFRTPRQPKERRICDKCGLSGGLSRNGGTGEITCMRTGCGHDHGFDEHDEELPLDQLVNITAQSYDRRKNKFREELTVLLQEGVKEKFLTLEVATQILQAAA